MVKCPVCKQRTRSRKGMVKHMKEHHGAKSRKAARSKPGPARGLRARTKEPEMEINIMLKSSARERLLALATEFEAKGSALRRMADDLGKID